MRRLLSGKNYGLSFAITVVALLGGVFLAFASATNGTIDSVSKYAWGSQIGWVNFGADNSNIQITDSGITGYAWSQNYGWINMNPTTTSSGIKNDGNGKLSGSAWGEQIGYINFSNVTINSSGKFTGSATTDSMGTISFDCPNCTVLTDWRPQSSRTSTSGSVTPSLGSGGGALSYSPPIQQPTTQSTTVSQQSLLQKATKTLQSLLSLLLGQQAPGKEINLPPAAVSETPPAVMSGNWMLLPESAINNFVFAPLPEEISSYIEKFPSLGKTLKEMGINRQSDLEKLRGTQLTLPNLSQSSGLFEEKLGNQPAVLAVPLSEMSQESKDKIPEEVIFTRSAGEKIDVNPTIKINQDGSIEPPAIKAVAGTPLYLVVKPAKPAASVKGYIIFLPNGQSKGGEINSGSLLDKLQAFSFLNKIRLTKSTALGRYYSESLPGLASISEVDYKQILADSSSATTKKLALAEFDYKDSGGGIYEANVQMPVVSGNYEIITRINYQDKGLAPKDIDMTAVIDPEGYIYESSPDGQIRIAGAQVAIYQLNAATNKFELWPGKEYSQQNPQTTDVQGTYSFLVPEGTYSIRVNAKGYKSYIGESFEISEGAKGINFYIELKKENWYSQFSSWQIFSAILIFVVIVWGIYSYRKQKVKIVM